MNLEALYNEVKVRLDRLDFDKLWLGFKPLKFALYTKDKVYFDGAYIPKTDSFCANTSINYNGEMIAIWFLEDENMDMDILTSCMVHEMFHGYQNMNGWDYFPNEFEALVNYKYDSYNLSTKVIENRLLLEILKDNDLDKLKNINSLRKIRSEVYPFEFEYEAKTQIIEGSANYVEWQVLKQLNKEKEALFINKMDNKLNDYSFYLPIRISEYFSGALLIDALLKENNYDYDGIIHSILNPKKEKMDLTLLNLKEVSSIIDSFYLNIHNKIEEAIKNNKVVLEGEYTLVGYNCYDGVYLDSYLLSRYFVAYLDNNQVKYLYGDFVILVDENRNIKKIYEAKL